MITLGERITIAAQVMVDKRGDLLDKHIFQFQLIAEAY
jgi:hypothetical protein